METKLTEQESLAIINEMIKQARNNFQKGSGNGMIFYGLLVSVLALLNVILAFVFIKLNINADLSFWIWCLMIPGFYAGYLIEKRVERKALVKTHLDSIIIFTWKAFSYSFWVFLTVIFCIGFGKKFYDVFFLINPVLLILTGMAEFACAKTYRFKPYLYGSIIMWLGALVCVAVAWTFAPVIFQLLILALCMFFGFVIPGNQLNKLAKDSQ